MTNENLVKLADSLTATAHYDHEYGESTDRFYIEVTGDDTETGVKNKVQLIKSILMERAHSES